VDPAAPAPLVLRPDWHYHFLGIGGVGMSALAAVLHRRGLAVSGTDTRESPTLDRLRDAGIPVTLGHEAAGLRGVNAVIYTTAIPKTHPIWAEVERLRLPRHHRAQVLGALAAERRTLAITGTHGKTTSSAALGHVFLHAGWDPTVLVGGEAPQLSGGTHHVGGGEWLVCEADESDGSFVNLNPEGVLLTNIEADHLDQHGTLDNLIAAFSRFLSGMSPSGRLVYCADDPLASRLGRALNRETLSYGVSRTAGVRVQVHHLDQEGMVFTLHQGERTHEVRTRVSGRQNALNLAGVFTLATAFGVPDEVALAALATFQGVGRRQQFVGRRGSLLVFDDYGHHPTEVSVTVEQFMAIHGAPLTVVFQPHLYSRTAYFADAFAEALRPATRIYVTEVYGAREQPIAGVSGQMIVDRLGGHPHARFLPDWKQVEVLDREGALNGGVLLTLGAGDITGLGPLLLRSGPPEKEPRRDS